MDRPMPDWVWKLGLYSGIVVCIIIAILALIHLKKVDSQEHLDLMRDKCFEDIQRGTKSSEGYWIWNPGYHNYEVTTDEME